MRIKLMADYECAPLWWDEQQRVGNIRPEEIGLSNALCVDLWDWAEAFDATLNRGDPVASGFASEAAETRFHERGRHLAGQVVTELGAGATIRYWPTDR